jgi:replicative DNA helicase
MAPYRKVQTRIWNDQKFALLAKSEDVSLLALSQLARPRDGDINSRPSLLQLKESGDIEASAHNGDKLQVARTNPASTSPL